MLEPKNQTLGTMKPPFIMFMQLSVNPRLTKLFFCNTSNWGVATPSLDFPNRTLYEIGFGMIR